jgi:hypothetical protein
MVSEEFIAATLHHVKSKTNGKHKLDVKHWQYDKTIEALRIIIDRNLDRVWGFELLFIVDQKQTFFQVPRTPGIDYKPKGFIKKQYEKVTTPDPSLPLSSLF